MMKAVARIISVVYCLIPALFCSPAFAVQSIEQRGIELSFDYQNLSDGFGNIKTIEVKGVLRNTTSQDASKIRAAFRLTWLDRNAIIEKLDIDNLAAKSSREFQLLVDLGQNPAPLEDISAKFTTIKLEKTRQISPASVHNILTREEYSLTRLTDEGRNFCDMVQDLRKRLPFAVPIKDEFETSAEYDNRLNQLENEHFSRLMDEIEKLYGEHVGGKGAIVRFLPKNIAGQLVYSTENSVFFQLPIRLGPYDADRGLFSDVNFNPRTISFEPLAVIPKAEIQLEHKDKLFFLRKPEFRVEREEGRRLRECEKNLVLVISLRFSVIQNGPYLDARAIIEQIQLLDTQSSKVFRTWSLEAQ